MPRPKPEVARVPVLIRFHPETVAMIDERRGERSRADWLALVVNTYLADQLPPMSEEEVARVMKGISSKPYTISPKPVVDIAKPVVDIKIGAPRAVPGSRLKKR